MERYLSRSKALVTSFLWVAFALSTPLNVAQSAEPTVLRDFYSTPGLNPFEERTNDNFNESISPFNGILQFTNTDVYLPGNGGMDIRVIRRYQSSVEERNIKQVYGYGWEISYGELRFSTGNVLDSANCTSAAGLFDTKDNPIFITAGGSSELLVSNDGAMSGVTDAILVSKGRYKLACEPAVFPATGNVWVVYSPDGLRYELGYQSPSVDVTGRFKLYATKISDSNGNAIHIDYAINSALVVYITSVYDTSDGRKVSFIYTDLNTNDIRLQSINTGTQVWGYEYESIYDYNDAAGALDGFLGYPDFDNYHLIRVARPDGQDWGYEYYVEEPIPDEIGTYQNWHHLIKSVRYPYGGNIEYEYQDMFFGAASPFYAKPHQVIKTKTVNTIGVDRISNVGHLGSVTDDTWTYSFFPGQGGLSNSSEQIGDLTIVQTPFSIESYLHYGYEHTLEGDIWRIGLLISKGVYNENDETLYLESNTWAPQAISSEAYWNGRGPSFRDSQTRAPLLVKKEIAQDGVVYTTDYSNHDNFGNPVNIVRGGTSVPDSIDTTYSYFVDTDLWIVNRPQDEITVDVGSITRTFDAKGNLEQQNSYGVTTNFTYTPEGDLATQTDANNNTTTYSDYFRGIPRLVEYPENKSIVRTVNETGTVASETSGRGFTTNYDYDVMDRLLLVDYPIHADVTISYAANNSRLVRTLTRGNYRETTRFNYLMNPVQIEKTDLTTGATITTINEFDILGRQTFVSKPTYGSYPNRLTQPQRDQFGITTILDALGRELEVRNPDDTQRYVEYRNQGGAATQPDAGSIRVIDERGNVTINRFNGYGSPGDRHLVKIEAPENMTTAATYDKLGNITSIWQGEEGDIGHARRYNFDSRFFLISEDHPEIGHVVFGRDAVGNLTSRQVKNSDVPGSTLPDSDITTYAYDGLNRLQMIDYPGSTPDVSYTYDTDDNLKTVNNSNSTRAYAYDENGNLTTEAITIDMYSYSLAYSYNNLDYLDTLTYPSSRSVIYENDAFGRPTRIVNYIDQVTYFPGGQKETVLYANGMSTAMTLNNREWVNSIIVGNNEESGLIDLAYLYDGRGNVKQITDGLDINSRSMTYDGVDRLKTADGMWGSGIFDYDYEDNMTARSIAGNDDIFTDVSNRMVQLQRNGSPYITPSYDVYGNQLNTANRGLLFDNANNLVRAQVVQGQAAPDIFFNYDGNNRRVTKKVGLINPDTRHYVYSKGDVVFTEVDLAANSTKENIYLGSQIVASTKFDSSDPIAVISLPASALEKVMVTLDGTGSFDPDGTIVTYEWSQVSGTSVTLVDLGAGMAEFESPIVVSDEKLVFQLQVRDDNSNASSTVAGINIQQTDIDDDGISDLWEAIYFPGDLTQLGESVADIDNDGFTDLEEFWNNTHPVNFDRLDAPKGFLITPGISSVDLAWPAVERATRYAVYVSTTPIIPLSESNRAYTTSSPFVQDDLMSGQFLYYVIVAERLDINGSLLGNSPPSDIVDVKVGWRTWSQRIIHSTQFTDSVELAVNEQGDATLKWFEYPDVNLKTDYQQQAGWSIATPVDPDTPDSDIPEPYKGPNVRAIMDTDGIHAEYYDPVNGWGNEELIFADSSGEYSPYRYSFNSNDEGVVIISRLQWVPSFTQTFYSLYYSPVDGWQTIQPLPKSSTGASLNFSYIFFMPENDDAQFVYYDAGFQVITFSPASGWSNPTTLGLSGTSLTSSYANEIAHLIVREDSGTPGLETLKSVHYFPGQGWSSVYALESIPGDYSGPVEIVRLNSGQLVAVSRERYETAYRIQELVSGVGWQLLHEHQLPTSCDYDDYPDNIDEILGGDPIPVTQLFPTNNPWVTFNIADNEQGVMSVVTTISASGGYKSNMLVNSRFEPGVGWLEDKILHCPWTFWSGFAIREVSQDMNSIGTTFVAWIYADEGEFVTDLKLLSNSFELLKGDPPIADAGPDLAATEGDEVTLDAILSTDPDNTIEDYKWMQIAGPTVNISDSDMSMATFIAPLVKADEVLTFELTVADESGNQDTDTVDVIVSDFSSKELGVVLVSSSGGPLTSGDLLNLSAQVGGDAGGDVEYQFRYKSLVLESEPWSVIKDFDNVGNAIWDTASLGGMYRLQVRVREVGNESNIVKDSVSIWVNSTAPLTGVTLGSNVIGPQLEGFVANLSAIPSGSSESVEYRFEVKNTAVQSNWILINDFAAIDAFDWATSGYQGKNKLRVSARKAGTFDLAVTDTMVIWINAPDAVTSVSLAPSSFSPQPSGTGITFAASVTGGNGNVEYRFSIKDAEILDEWVVAQNWSTSPAYAWDTTGIFGKQRIRVEARNIGSSDRALADRMSYWLNDDNPLTEVDLQVNQPGLLEVGSSITLTGVPAGSANLFEYQFLIKGAEPGASWSVLRDFSSDPTLQVGSVSFLGKNKFQVRARNQGSLDREVKDNETIWINEANAITDVALSGSSSSVVWGETITFNLSFTGGDGSYYLMQELKNPGEEFSGNEYFWSMSTTSFDFDVDGMMPGTYRMRVQVINGEKDRPVKSNSVEFTVSANTNPKWQEGGANYGNIQACTVYECPCAIFNSCDVDTTDPDVVFGDGY